mmetsp:Transcript_8843/g.12580  ORF Transcript_8843/g.12580 Transcript_8843/m.12580 type:complete len:126 (-) Transcript_8843:124-501(-)
MMLRFYKKKVIMVPKEMNTVFKNRFKRSIEAVLEVAMVELLKKSIRLEWEQIREYWIKALIRNRIEKEFKYTSRQNVKISKELFNNAMKLRAKRLLEEAHIQMSFADDVMRSLREVEYVISSSKV